MELVWQNEQIRWKWLTTTRIYLNMIFPMHLSFVVCVCVCVVNVLDERVILHNLTWPQHFAFCQNWNSHPFMEHFHLMHVCVCILVEKTTPFWSTLMNNAFTFALSAPSNITNIRWITKSITIISIHQRLNHHYLKWCDHNCFSVSHFWNFKCFKWYTTANDVSLVP